MTGLSSAGEAAVLSSLTTNCYVSLHTTDPGDTGAAEIAGGAYARQGPVPFTNSGNNPTVAANSAIVTFPVATASWGTIAYFGLWMSCGSFYGSGLVNTTKVVNTGDQARFQTGSLTVTVQ